MERHNIRTKRIFKDMTEAIAVIRYELKDFHRRTSRSFWVKGTKYIARKTNLHGVNLNVTEVVK